MRMFGWARKADGPSTLPVDPTEGDRAAAELLDWLRMRYWSRARQVLADAVDADHLSALVDAGSQMPGLESWLPDIVRDELADGLSSLLYGAGLISWAWEARGGAYARYVGQDQFRLFFERLRMAEDCLQGVVRREPGNAAAWHHLVITARGLELGLSEAQRRFEQAVAHHPGHLRAHQQMLQTTCAKWSGSHQQMHDFARTSMLGAPAGSPLGHLVALAHIEEALSKAKYPKDIESYFRSRRVRSELRAAADRSVGHPAYRRGSDWASVHSAFAMAFALAGEHRAAAEQFQVLGDVVLAFPWKYLDEPGQAFCMLRNRAYARA